MDKLSELEKKYPLKGNFNIGTVPELAWVLDNIRYKGTALDVGCQESRLGDFLVDYYDDVWGIDINEKSCWGDFSDKRYKFVVGDIRLYEFSTTFDDIIFMSSLEHIGKKAYHNNLIQDNGDRLALLNSKLALSDNGLMYVTIPYGDWHAGTSRWGDDWMRVYNAEALDTLTNGFEIIKKDFVDNDKRVCMILR